MIERKRRCDFVRSREFDMLRKLRRPRRWKGSDFGGGGPSFYPSTSPPIPAARLTLKKIDEMRQMMSTTWFKAARSGQSPAEPAAMPRAPSVHVYGKTDPMPLPPPPGCAPLLDAAWLRATVTLDPMSAPAR